MKNQAKEHANLLQEYEEGKQRDLESENKPNEGVEEKDQELKVKVEEIERDEQNTKGKRRGQSKKR